MAELMKTPEMNRNIMKIIVPYWIDDVYVGECYCLEKNTLQTDNRKRKQIAIMPEVS